MVDVSQHNLVPEHRIVSDSELDDVLDEYNIERTDLPKIKRTDAGIPDQAEVGDVLEIVRDSRTTDQAVVYRLVIQ
ncbi:MAG: DNA-directed RNA polymerase subunit H [Halobacteriales archaeon]|nr:DNA-directed RNA polymerase subunit H [Halobacteriales archaeon]